MGDLWNAAMRGDYDPQWARIKDRSMGNCWSEDYRRALHEHLWDVFCLQWVALAAYALIGRE